MNTPSTLKIGVALLTLATLTSCASKDLVTVIENKPSIYPSEASLLPFPVKPDIGLRTNASMHNYRKQVEEWGCDVASQFDSFVARVTKDQSISIPSDCIEITTGDRKYLFLD